MLISCPKCRSIYEIPDDLIGKTGKNLRCQSCNNIWHAMVEDTLGYQKKKNEKPFVEGIVVSEPDIRNYPSNKEGFSVPLDNPELKFKPTTPSSFDIVNKEGGVVDTSSMVKPKADNELTLTSDKGTSFTISMGNKYPEEKAQHFFDDNTGLKATNQDRLLSKKTKTGYKLTYFVLFLLFVCAGLLLLRREIVSFHPETEQYYNKIALTGMDNSEYLKFRNVNIVEKNIEEKDVVIINADIYNNSLYITRVPDIAIKGSDDVYKPHRDTLDKYETTSVAIVIDKPKSNELVNFTLEFRKK